ncbi:MAG TPA: DUF1952 domain-containing protein, partial [Anaerolineae bacterium]|nr:DUF1952 domain-containing protein [Anaerolineae bacterium]
MQTIVREMRGIPLWLLREYLQEMGGTAVDDYFVQAAGWSVRLARLDPFRLGSLEVCQTRLEIEIEDQLVEPFMQQFSKKTLRA